MRALLIGALAATLTGCACFAPQPTINGCTPMTGYACPAPAAGKPAAFTVDMPNAKSARAANAQDSPSAQSGKKTRPVPKRPTHNTVGQMKPLPSAQLG